MTDYTSTQNPEQERSFFGVIVHSFFVIPFLIAVFAILLFTSITLLTRDKRTVYDLLEDIKVGSLTKRWQSAFELTKVLANPQLIPEEERFIADLSSAFRNSMHDDDRVRQYLALAMARTGKTEFFPVLTETISKEKEENLYTILYALGMLKDKRAVPILGSYLNHTSARIRSLVVVSLGSIGDISAKEFLKKALNDSEPNVQWGASISLAQMDDASGVHILEKLLDRSYLAKYSEVDPQEQTHLIIAAINAAQELNNPELNERLRILSTSDQNMKVRTAAMNALK